ncbi:hypothetical protein BRYFOR_07726 [Marvinbryantia formatexigens DSM 14469]|uniref:Uncharacterized protein n=1 Tax=Marvinbryantia formatexigens DSM 14469 TaxID=478749 RepID=C6LGG6_9FIRM|nr:hypothetical protein BRYFOR_07726 [Marvinbryantia formatexigens DSM 14469]
MAFTKKEERFQVLCLKAFFFMFFFTDPSNNHLSTVSLVPDSRYHSSRLPVSVPPEQGVHFCRNIQCIPLGSHS